MLVCDVTRNSLCNSSTRTFTTTSSTHHTRRASVHRPVASSLLVQPTAGGGSGGGSSSGSSGAIDDSKDDDASFLPIIAELGGLCEAIDVHNSAATAAAARLAAAAAAVQRNGLVKDAEAATRSASPASSGSSETSSDGSSSSSAPFGQVWVATEDSPLLRVTKKEPAKLRPLQLMDVWIIDVPAQHCVSVFEFVRRHDLQKSEAGHLKRVHRASRDPQAVSILIKTSVEDESEGIELARLIRDDPLMADLPLVYPYIKAVPAAPAESSEQLSEWSEIWPISFIPMHAGPRARSLPKKWTEHQIEWVRQGMDRVAELAQQAKARGELPIACMVSNSYDLAVPPESQPHPQELASHHDTRHSTGNTLCHAFRNLIAAVADIDRRGARQSPKTPPTSRGATLPYLLTSMTLFSSHEPCLLCSMALLHSRVQTIIYAHPASGAGGCGSVYDVHEDEGLNHKFEVWWWRSGMDGIDPLEVDP